MLYDSKRNVKNRNFPFEASCWMENGYVTVNPRVDLREWKNIEKRSERGERRKERERERECECVSLNVRASVRDRFSHLPVPKITLLK